MGVFVNYSPRPRLCIRCGINMGEGREGSSCLRGSKTMYGCREEDRSTPGNHGSVVDQCVVLKDMQFYYE